MRLPQSPSLTKPALLVPSLTDRQEAGPRLRQARELLIALATGGLVGLLAALGFGAIALALVGVVIFLWVGFRWPEVAILTVIGINSGLVDTEAIPWIPLGPITLHISDLLLIFLLALIFLRGMSQPGFRLYGSPLVLPLLLFMLALVISVGNAVLFQGVGANDALRLARFIAYWMVFFPVIELVRDEKTLRRLIKGLWILAAILFAGTLFPNVLDSIHVLPVRETGISEAATTTLQSENIRLYTYGERMFFVLIPTAAAVLAISKRRQFWIGLMLAALFLWLFRSFQRNYLLAILMSLGLLLLLIPPKGAARLSRRVAPMLLLLVAVVVISVMVQPGQIRTQVDAWNARLASMLGETGQVDPNLEYRFVENHYALQSIEAHPIFGIGVRNNYRPLMMYETQTTGLTWFMHNAYLWIWLMMGLVGLIPFLILCAIYVIRTFRHYRDIHDDELRAIYLGFGVAFVGTLVSNLVAPNFIQHWSLLIYPTMMGINEVIYRLSTGEQTS
ncbi:O-antigen ligase family protein [Aggregatilinea lenta]|uniref:O-antigen ligase family protein n=1 Tax=Aggregatilinea lenta TaxID=913108 RepID=UPI000E5AFE82|nr:O-antigen ligase family protein [Aggregatilinea lenta]